MKRQHPIQNFPYLRYALDILTLVLVLNLFAFSVNAQTDYENLRGSLHLTVTNRYNIGVADCNIQMLKRDNVALNATTNEYGVCFITLKPGRYTVKTSCKHYRTNYTEQIIISTDHTTKWKVRLEKATRKQHDPITKPYMISSIMGSARTIDHGCVSMPDVIIPPDKNYSSNVLQRIWWRVKNWFN